MLAVGSLCTHYQYPPAQYLDPGGKSASVVEQYLDPHNNKLKTVVTTVAQNSIMAQIDKISQSCWLSLTVQW